MMRITLNKRFNQKLKFHPVHEIDEYLLSVHFNGQIRIRNDEKVIMHESYGYKNLSFDPITYDTQFLSASIQKFITGIIIEQLIDEQKLNRTDRVARYIPHIASHILIEDLLLHISGLTRYKVYKDIHGLDEAVSLIEMCGATLPYHKFDYNDANFILLAKIIELVEKTPFRTVIYDRIIDKYQLEHSCFYDETYDATTGIHQYGEILIEDWHSDLDKYYGAGNMYMSLKDIDTLSQSFARYNIFNMDKTKEIVSPDRFQKQKYRSGISLRDNFLRIRGTLYAHDVVAYFNECTFIAVATNRESDLYKAEDILRQIIDTK
ncbi:beta-lactamase family protein [Macrococcus armenti]|uniref:serine hydrolase domain-containing protein n=1 Tax=Macrococcus armenti TaxID=2875764 RepID=UPI001CCF079B|nr:serine hydrolase domain-containing protein [Macrococcus armenti]UBH22963.1 beta-lactamase family protein [Macrococcus armenti]